jgi:hypothetical protein
MTATAEQWTVCGSEPDCAFEPMTLDLFDSFDSADRWLRNNYGRFPSYLDFYVDRASNERVPAHTYYRVLDGELTVLNP